MEEAAPSSWVGNALNILGPTAFATFFELEAKIVTNCDLTPSWVRIGGDKNGAKKSVFRIEDNKIQKKSSKHRNKSQENTGIYGAF